MEPLKERIAAKIKQMRIESPEWRDLLKAIRKVGQACMEPEQLAEIKALGQAACLDGNQLSEIASMTLQVDELKALAAKAPSLTKQYQAIERQVADLSEALGASTNEATRCEITEKLERAEHDRRQAEVPYVGARQAVARLAAFRAEGIIE